MFKNTAAKFMVFAFDTTTNTPKTGDAANITAYVSKDYGSVTVLADTSATEMDATNAKGYYLFDAAQGETNGDCLMVSAKSTTANISVIGAPSVIYTRPTTNWLAPATLNRTIVVDAAGLADANVVKVGPTGSGTAQTAGDLKATMGTPAGASLAADLAEIEGETDALLAGVIVTTNNDKTGYALTAGERNSVADALLDRDMSVGADSGSSTVRTVRQVFRFIRNKWTLIGTTLTVYKEDDATSSWTGTVTTDAAATPITANDPAGP